MDLGLQVQVQQLNNMIVNDENEAADDLLLK